MYARLALTLEGGPMEFGADAQETKRSLAAYLRSVAVRIESLNDNNAMCSILDDVTGGVVGTISLAIIAEVA